MTDQTGADPTLDRLLRHMAWANATLLTWLEGLPDAALGLAAPRNEWTVALILEHLVSSADGYAARLEGLPRPERGEPPTSAAQLADFATRCAAADARIRAQATLPDGPALWPGQTRIPARSTVLAQAIHHAIEHRAQIAAALATNGIDAIDLDELDVWAYGNAEGLGQ